MFLTSVYKIYSYMLYNFDIVELIKSKRKKLDKENQVLN